MKSSTIFDKIYLCDGIGNMTGDSWLEFDDSDSDRDADADAQI